MTDYALLLFTATLIALSMWLVPKRVGDEGFFSGKGPEGQAPTLWVLVLSQVTTWIFARSLLNAAVLGYYYGFAGALAYTAYYGSFLTGLLIVDRIRAERGSSVQDWLAGRFGKAGVAGYNLVIALRLLSEVFANLLVIGVIFGESFAGTPYASEIAMVVLALAGLIYSMQGGLWASLRTDVIQMMIFLAVFSAAFVALIMLPEFSLSALAGAEGLSGDGPGWVLLAVAALQVISYPAHDPVMMDRGFLADRRVTRQSFLHAFWISAFCIMGFGLFGIQAGLMATDGEAMQAVWARMFSPVVLFLLNAALIVSALSTLDSALSSAARLSLVELKLAPISARNGRIAMAVFMLGGVLFLLGDTTDLYAAVAVSGTASMFLTPVLVLGLGFGLRIPLWSYLASLTAALLGAAAYFFRGAGPVANLLGEGHKYEHLLLICLFVLLVGFSACLIGAFQSRVQVAD